MESFRALHYSNPLDRRWRRVHVPIIGYSTRRPAAIDNEAFGMPPPEGDTETTESESAEPNSDSGAEAGIPADVLRPFADAIIAAAKPASGDSDVSRAFALGWQMAELHGRHRRGGGGSPGRLPGLSSLDAAERRAILVRQIEAGIAQLGKPIEEAGLKPPALDGEPTSVNVRAFHVNVLGTLAATDYRLGKAYGLGRALADTCLEPDDAETFRAELGHHRIANLLGWLDELTSALPPYAAGSVSRSLKRWRDYAAQPGEAPEGTLLALRRQGELWRALLSGEKRGKDMLELGNYLEAAERFADETARLAREVLRRFPVITALAVALLVIGVVLLVVVDSAASIVAGAASILAAAGLTWKGLGGAAGKLVAQVEQPLWNAELDIAICDAITLLPENEGDHGDRRALALEMRRPDLERSTDLR
jgi:hypothetical protein